MQERDNTKGKCTKIESWNPEKTAKFVYVNKFGKKQYLKKVTNTDSWYNAYSKKWYSEKYEYTYTTSLRKGLPKKIVATSKNDGIANSYRYTTTFTKKGLVSNITRTYSGTTYNKARVKYRIKKGRVVSAVEYSYDSFENKWKPETKYTFKYTKKKISKDRYAKMINAEMSVWGISAYEFLWY